MVQKNHPGGRSMASWASLILLSIAVSLDGFGAGVSYGVRKIRIPPLSIGIISICSGTVIFLAMMAGTLLAQFIPPKAASASGALILMAVGFWALFQLLRSGEQEGSALSSGVKAQANSGDTAAWQTEADSASAPNPLPARKELWTLEIRQWGIMIQILRTPSAADLDRSGTIAGREAVFLGAALSLDAFGAGIGAAMAGFPPLTTALFIAGASGLFLHLGTRFGLKMSGWSWVRQLAVLPGIILILMGIYKLL
jgi:putative Mn2+ efflux pump MntP